MFSDPDLVNLLVLKGGAAVDLIHHINARSSIDIDFSLPSTLPYEDDEAAEKLSAGLSDSLLKGGYQIIDFKLKKVPPGISPDLLAFWGGYKVEFKVVTCEDFNMYQSDPVKLSKLGLHFGAKGKMTIDISMYEFCQDKIEAEIEGHRIFAYSKQMIICEKLRAICQQHPEYCKQTKSHSAARARDFVDIVMLQNTLDEDFVSEENLKMLREFFQAKQVPLELMFQLEETRILHEGDYQSVRDSSTVELENFDFYYQVVTALIQRIKNRLEQIDATP